MIKKSIKKPYFSLKPQLYEALNYIKDNRKYIYFAICLFLLSISFGFIMYAHLTFIDQYLKEIVNTTQNLSGWDLISFIFKNNLQTSFLSLFLGIFFGVFTLFSTITNGVVIGYVIEKVYVVTGFLQLWKLFPHGILELPAVFISLGLGFKLGTLFFKKINLGELKKELYQCLLVFLFVVVPLLILAAIIEGSLITLLK